MKVFASFVLIVCFDCLFYFSLTNSTYFDQDLRSVPEDASSGVYMPLFQTGVQKLLSFNNEEELAIFLGSTDSL